MLDYETVFHTICLREVSETATEKDASSYWCASNDKFDKRPAAGHACTIFVSVTVLMILCALTFLALLIINHPPE